MSDPYGNHYCPHAKGVCEFNGKCMCNVINHEVMCGGVWENCVLPDERIDQWLKEAENQKQK